MLTRSARPGFSLPELLIATTISLIVSGAVYQLLVTTQRLSRAQAEHLSLQSNVRAAVLIVLNELRELSSAAGKGSRQNDVLTISPSGLVYRAMRGFGALCQPSTATEVRLARGSFSGHRDPQPGRDSAFVYLGAATDIPDDDAWLPVGINAVAALSVCGGTGQAGINLSVPANDSLIGLPSGTPVRIFEIAELKLYQSERKFWLGLRSVSAGEAIQPVTGPLTNEGLRFEPLDGQGRVSTADVQSIRATVIGVSQVWDSVQEELIAEVALRNVVGR